MHLPNVQKWTQWEKIYTDEKLWEPVARKICDSNGLSFQSMEKGFPGTHAVFLLDHLYVIKIYCPLASDDYKVESILYEKLADCPDIPAPGQLAHGVFEDRIAWPYVILEYKDGTALRDIRNQMTKDNFVKMAGALGKIVRSFHSVPVNELSCFHTFSWKSFVEQRKRDCLSEIAERNLFSEKVLAEIKSLVHGFKATEEKPVLINADLTEDHILLERTVRTWKIDAVIDVADAKAGVPKYEWVVLWFDLFRQDRDCMEAFFKSYDPNTDFDSQMNEDVIVYTFLHQFSADILEMTMSRLGNPYVESLQQLKTILWAV